MIIKIFGILFIMAVIGIMFLFAFSESKTPPEEDEGFIFPGEDGDFH